LVPRRPFSTAPACAEKQVVFSPFAVACPGQSPVGTWCAWCNVLLQRSQGQLPSSCGQSVLWLAAWFPIHIFFAHFSGGRGALHYLNSIT
jgi:hypothetical protein